jgi:hypothetical protein
MREITSKQSIDSQLKRKTGRRYTPTHVVAGINPDHRG